MSPASEPAAKHGDVDLPPINFRLRRSEPFPLCEAMKPVHVGLVNQRIELVYRSSDELAEIIFFLNFADERLEFDIDHGFKLCDDGTASAARNGKERCRFIWDYFGNGEIQIWDAEKGNLLTRVGAFMPLNMMANLDGHIAQLAAWDKVIADRKQAEGMAH